MNKENYRPNTITFKLSFPSGEEIDFKVPLKKRVPMSDEVFVALEVMQQVKVEADFLGTTGVGEFPYRVEKEELIKNLPGNREQFPEDALNWAGATLVRNGWDAKRVAKFLIGDDISRFADNLDRKEHTLKSLESLVKKYYPSSHRKDKPAKPW